MTKRAKAIKAFIQELSQLALDGTPIRMAINGANSNMTPEKGKELLVSYERCLSAHLANILENNDEQAEALMNELGVCWKNNPYK